MGNIDIEFEIEEAEADRRRRILLQNNLETTSKVNVEVEAEFDMGNALYNDFFKDYNSTEFKVEYLRILYEYIGDNADGFSDFEVEDSLNIDSKNALIPTYAPHKFETRGSHDNRMMIIMVLF